METTATETWEKRMDREKAERITKINKSQAKMRQVFKLLGFTVVEPLDPNTWSARLSAVKDQADIFIESDGYMSQGRFVITGSYPRTRRGEYISYGINKVEITVTNKKTAEQVVKDIERRFMPDYMVELNKVIKQVEDDNDYHDSRESMLTELKGSKLDDYEEKNGEFSISSTYGVWGTVKAYRDNVTIELRDLTVKQAKQILDIAQGNHAA